MRQYMVGTLLDLVLRVVLAYLFLRCWDTHQFIGQSDLDGCSAVRFLCFSITQAMGSTTYAWLGDIAVIRYFFA